MEYLNMNWVTSARDSMLRKEVTRINKALKTNPPDHAKAHLQFQLASIRTEQQRRKERA